MISDAILQETVIYLDHITISDVKNNFGYTLEYT